MDAILEILFYAIIEIFAAIIEHRLGYGQYNDRNYTTWTKFWMALCYLIAGIVIGGITLLIFPDPFIKNETVRYAVLLFSPLFAGFLMHTVKNYREKHDKKVVSMENFWFAFLLAFGISSIRFLFA